MSTSADSDWSIWRDDRWLGPRSVICNRVTRVFIERRRRESWLIWRFDALSFVGDKCPIEDIGRRLLRPCRRQSHRNRDECTYLLISRATQPDGSDLHKSKLLLTARRNCSLNGNFSENRLRLAFRFPEAVTTLMDERLRQSFSFPEARKVSNCCENIEFRRFPSFASFPLVSCCWTFVTHPMPSSSSVTIWVIERSIIRSWSENKNFDFSIDRAFFLSPPRFWLTRTGNLFKIWLFAADD